MPRSSQTSATTAPAEPLTVVQLAGIQARAEAATPGPWEPIDYGKDYYGWIRGGHLRGVGTLDFGDGDDAEADRDFVLHAREDVDALLAEVERLKGQRRYLIEQIAKKDARSGEGDAALHRFLQAAEPFVPRTERSYWVDIAAALNTAESVGMSIGIDLDGTITDRNAWSVIWDRDAKQWTVAGYDEEATS